MSPYRESLAPVAAQYGLASSELIPVATNPPVLLWLFAPFSLLPPEVAFYAWLGLQLACLGLTLLWTRSLLGVGLDARGWWRVGALVVMSEPVFYHLVFSQTQLLLGALLLGALVLRQQGRHGLACCLVTAAGLVKLFPFVLLPWFCCRGATPRQAFQRWLAAGVFGGLVFLGAGPALWRDFWENGLPVVTAFAAERSFNFSVPSLLATLGRLGWGDGPWWAVGVSGGVTCLGLGYWRCFRGAPRDEEEFGLLLVTMLACSTTSWGHYYVLLAFPVVLMAWRLEADWQLGRVLGLALVVGLFMHGLGPEPVVGGPPRAAGGRQLLAIVWLGWAGVVAGQLWRAAGGTGPAPPRADAAVPLNRGGSSQTTRADLAVGPCWE